MKIKMDKILLKIISIFCINFVGVMNYRFHLEPPTNSDSQMLASIVNNFINKYFSDKNTFPAIHFKPDNGTQKQFQLDFISNLVIDSTGPQNAFVIMRDTPDTIRIYRKPFIIMLAQDFNKFS